MNKLPIDTLILKISNDMNKALYSNLSTYFNTVNEQATLLDSLKNILFHYLMVSARLYNLM